MTELPVVRQRINFAEPAMPVAVNWSRGLPGGGQFAYHPEMELHYVRQGQAVYLVRDKHYRLRPGSLLVINPDEPHLVRPAASGRKVEKLSLIFKPDLAGLPPTGLLSVARDFRHARLAPSAAVALTGIAATLVAECRARSRDWQMMCRLKLRELTILMKRACANPVRADRVNPMVESLLVFIERHYEAAIDNGKLARMAGISASRLMHVFRQHMGVGIKQYVLLYRIAKACELLGDEQDMKVDAIARNVGFNYFAGFNRAFKMHTGMTPTAYRTACQAGRPPDLGSLTNGRRRSLSSVMP